MDEKTIKSLLECSVCLDTMDSSAKVLPCQHTFCRLCLKEIVRNRGLLSCPECRAMYPYHFNVDLLPSNVFLVRMIDAVERGKSSKKNDDIQIQGGTEKSEPSLTSATPSTSTPRQMDVVASPPGPAAAFLPALLSTDPLSNRRSGVPILNPRGGICPARDRWMNNGVGATVPVPAGHPFTSPPYPHNAAAFGSTSSPPWGTVYPVNAAGYHSWFLCGSPVCFHYSTPTTSNSTPTGLLTQPSFPGASNTAVGGGPNQLPAFYPFLPPRNG